MRFSRHALVAAALAAAGACAFAQSASPEPEPKPGPVRAPHYGDSLFHFYQGKYFSAVTSLMVSQHFARMAPHDDESEVLRGGLLLSYGLHREAGQIFARLIERGAAPPVRDRAWYFLAKIRWQRGDVDGALEALGRVGDRLPRDLDDDRGLLHANVLMARGDHAGAAALLRTLEAKDGNGKPAAPASAAPAGFAVASAAPYIRYNLGAALVKSGELAAGSTLLDAVGRMPGASEEQRALRDKANVALGFAALRDGRADDARAALLRVRLEGPQSHKALLGLGWADAQAKQPDKALVPWTELAGRALGDAAVLEARIALPFAYAELGAFGQAQQGYEGALDSFDREHKALDESIAAVRSGKLLAALDRSNPGEEMGWFWKLDTLPELPHAGHLWPLVAQHEFQEAFKNWRDLIFLGRNLERWREALAAFDDMLATRRAAHAAALPRAQTGGAAGSAELVALQRRRAAIGAEIDRVQAETDVLAFPDARQDALLARLSDVQVAMQANAADPEVAALAERVRRVAGALSWQLAREFPDRLWQARRSVAAIDGQIAEARRHEAALAAGQRDEPARFDRFAARIAQLRAQIEALIPKVAALSGEQGQAVQAMAAGELVQQQERLAEYRTQARFALAQLVDRAQLAAGRGAGAGDAK